MGLQEFGIWFVHYNRYFFRTKDQYRIGLFRAGGTGCNCFIYECLTDTKRAGFNPLTAKRHIGSGNLFYKISPQIFTRNFTFDFSISDWWTLRWDDQDCDTFRNFERTWMEREEEIIIVVITRYLFWKLRFNDKQINSCYRCGTNWWTIIFSFDISVT